MPSSSAASVSRRGRYTTSPFAGYDASLAAVGDSRRHAGGDGKSKVEVRAKSGLGVGRGGRGGLRLRVPRELT